MQAEIRTIPIPHNWGSPALPKPAELLEPFDHTLEVLDTVLFGKLRNDQAHVYAFFFEPELYGPLIAP
jgi:hypothetical protein